MKSVKSILFLLFAILGANVCQAQETLTRGDVVSSEANLISGKPYLFFYVGASSVYSCYVKASASYEYFMINWGDQDITEEAIFCFIGNGNNTWKIKSRNSGKYFPEPENKQFMIPTDDVSKAGDWTLNYLNTSGVLAPYCGNEGFDRYLISSNPQVFAVYATEKNNDRKNQYISSCKSKVQ